MEYVVLVEKTKPSSVNPDLAGIGTLNVLELWGCQPHFNWDVSVYCLLLKGTGKR